MLPGIDGSGAAPMVPPLLPGIPVQRARNLVRARRRALLRQIWLGRRYIIGIGVLGLALGISFANGKAPVTYRSSVAVHIDLDSLPAITEPAKVATQMTALLEAAEYAPTLIKLVVEKASSLAGHPMLDGTGIDQLIRQQTDQRPGIGHLRPVEIYHAADSGELVVTTAFPFEVIPGGIEPVVVAVINKIMADRNLMTLDANRKMAETQYDWLVKRQDLAQRDTNKEDLEVERISTAQGVALSAIEFRLNKLIACNMNIRHYMEAGGNHALNWAVDTRTQDSQSALEGDRDFRIARLVRATAALMAERLIKPDEAGDITSQVTKIKVESERVRYVAQGIAALESESFKARQMAGLPAKSPRDRSILGLPALKLSASSVGVAYPEGPGRPYKILVYSLIGLTGGTILGFLAYLCRSLLRENRLLLR